MTTSAPPFPWTKAVVAGMARSGRAVAKLLTHHGVAVVGTDLRTEEDLHLAPGSLEGVDLVLGEQPVSLLDQAEVLIPSPGIPKTAPLLQEAMARKIPLVSELEVASRVAKAPLAAVTGTNGKSTVVTVLGEIVRAHGKPVVVAGNVGVALSEVVEQIPEHGVLVVEVSSYQLEDIEFFHPRVSTILNITPDHLDRYRGMDHYAQTKWRITENQTGADFFVVPSGDATVKPPAALKPQRIYFGPLESSWKAPAVTLTDELLVWNAPGAEPQVILGLEALPLLGTHNHLNIAAAIALSYGLGFDPASLETRAGLKNVAPLPHRMEPVGEVGGVRFVNDSKATNPEATLAALTSLDGPLILVAGGQAKKADYRALLPSLAPPKVRGIALVGEAQDQLAQDWEGSGVPIHRAGTDLYGAVAWAAGQAEAGFDVLLSPGCASFDMFRDFEHRGNAFREAMLRLQEERA